MKERLHRLVKYNEFYVALVIILICILITCISPVFATLYSMYDILRATIKPLIWAMGMYVVIVAGGFDLSLAGISAFSMFATTKLITTCFSQGDLLYDNVIFAYIISAAIGLALGCINGLLVANLKVPAMIITLGTNTIINGVLLFFIGSREISNVPAGYMAAGRDYVLSAEDATGKLSQIPSTVFIALGLIVLTFIIMKYTMLGRNIFAIGGDVSSAERCGVNVKKTTVFVYAYAGFIFGIAGMVQTVMNLNCNPVELTGMEMTIIAMVVIGGARIGGGHGSITGTVLGVLLITILNNSLNLIGISSLWQRFFTGIVIVIGASITAYQALRESRQLHVVVSDKPVK